MKKLRIIMIIFIIAIVIMIGTIILLNKKNTKSPEEIEQIMTHAGEQEDDELNDTVKNSEDFFTVSSCVSQYLDLLNKNYDIYYGYDDNNNYTQIINPYEAIQQILSENYIKNNNITMDNLEKHIPLWEEKVTFIPLKMRVIDNIDVEKYLVYGMIENSNNEYVRDIYLFVNLCGTNATFSIEPIDKQYNSIYDIEYTNEETIIDEKDFNDYVPVSVNSEYMCQQYFNLYKSIALAKPEIAFEFLDKEYKEKRFGDISSYKEYLSDNQEEIKNIQLSQYLVNGYDDYTEYVCKDQNENLYIFNETEIMKFNMKLDTYTIPTDNFKGTYNSNNVQKKVMMNIDKWVQMLNSRDYKAAYKVLNETFKNSNFGSEEKFKTYIRQKYPSHYKIEFLNFSEEGDTYVQHIKLKSITVSVNQEKELDIIMKLEEGTDFVMSFNIE